MALGAAAGASTDCDRALDASAAVEAGVGRCSLGKEVGAAWVVDSVGGGASTVAAGAAGAVVCAGSLAPAEGASDNGGAGVLESRLVAGGGFLRMPAFGLKDGAPFFFNMTAVSGCRRGCICITQLVLRNAP